MFSVEFAEKCDKFIPRENQKTLMRGVFLVKVPSAFRFAFLPSFLVPVIMSFSDVTFITITCELLLALCVVLVLVFSKVAIYYSGEGLYKPFVRMYVNFLIWGQFIVSSVIW